jgi:hypothetical protein
MTVGNANFYDLRGHVHGQPTHVTWYPNGKGGPIIAGGPPAGAPLLTYSNGGTSVTAWGTQLTVGAPTPAGTFVVAIVERSGLPGASMSLGVLIPDVAVNGAAVAVHTVGVLASHREVSQIGPGQVETYTEISLNGTAADVLLPR